MFRAQAFGRTDCFGDGLVVLTRVESRERPSDVTEAAQLVQRPTQLGLKHDDDRDDDEKCRVLEQPRQQHQVELGGHDADHSEQDQADEDLNALRASQEAEQLIKDDGHPPHVDDLEHRRIAKGLAKLQPELLQCLDHASPPNSMAISAICAYRRLPACWKTTERGPSITSSVTSSPRGAGGRS